MSNKFFDFFKSKKRKFHEQTKKEKSRLYLKKREKKSIYGKERFSKQKQLHINFKFKKTSLISLSFIGFISALIGIIFLFKAQYFAIQKITIESPDKLTDINIAYNSIDSFRNTNIFNINTDDILKRLQTYQPNIVSISLKKQLPNSLEIVTESSPIVLNVLYQEKEYSVTQNGIAIKKKENKETSEALNLKTIEIIQDKNSSPININYTNVLKDDVINKINIFLTSFQDNLIDLPIDKIQFYMKESELHILLKNKTLLIFDINGNVVEQIKKLIIFYKEKKKLIYIYIDLRIKNKIFYCDYENEFQCRMNLKKLYTKK